MLAVDPPGNTHSFSLVTKQKMSQIKWNHFSLLDLNSSH